MAQALACGPKPYIHRTNICTSMGFRTVSLSDDAYDRLAAMRLPGESFSDVVRRLTRGRSLTELGGILNRAEADALADAIGAARKERGARKRERLGR